MKLSKFWLIILFLLSLSCVRYSFRGALPSYLKTIYIEDFEYQSREAYPNVREDFMQKVTEAFIKDNSLRIIKNRKSADLVLSGSIVSVRREPVSINLARAQQVTEQVDEYHMTVTVKAECMNTHTQKPLWSGNLSRYGVISGTALTDEIDLAISQALDQIVEDIINKTIAAW